MDHHHHISATAWFQTWQLQGRFSVTSAGCLGFPVVKSTSLKIFFNCIHPMNLFSFHPACISWGLLTTVVLKVERVSLTPNHRLVDQSSPPYICSLKTVWSCSTPGLWVSILIASYDTHGLRWGYSCSRPPNRKLPMNTQVQLQYHLAIFFFEWEMFQTNVVQKIKCFRQTLYRKSNVSDKSCTENRNTRFMFGNVFPKFV